MSPVNLPHASTTSIKQTIDGIRWDAFFLCILGFLVVMSWLPRMQGPLDLRWDGGVYYVLGTALAEGKGYRLLNEPGEIEAVQYPPLFPAMIALHQRVLGTSDPVIVGRWLRLSFFLISLSYMICSYVLLRSFLPPLYAFGAGLMVALNLFTNFLSDLCFAEIPFALVVTAFVLCNRKEGRLYGAVSAILAMAAYLIRTMGIAVLMAWVCEALYNGQYRKAAIRASISLIPVLAWNGYIYSVESSLSYNEPAYTYQRAEYLFYNVSYARNVSLRDPFSPELGKLSLDDLTERFFHNLIRMPASLGEGLSAKIWYWRRFLTTMFEPVQNYSGVWRIRNYATDLVLPMAGMLIVVGMVLLLRHGDAFIPIYLLFVLLAVCLTPWPEQWPRYWAPTIPFLALGLFRTALAIRSGALTYSPTFRILRFTSDVLVGLIFVCQLFTLYTTYVLQAGQAEYRDRNGRMVSSRLFFYKQDGYRELDAGLDWLMIHAGAHDIVAASMPQWVYLRTGLKSVMPPFGEDPHNIQALLDSVPVTYIVMDTSPINFARDYVLPMLKQSPQHWSLVHTVPKLSVNKFENTDGEALEIFKRINR